VHFGAPALGAKSLALAGIDAVSLANNHAMDYGRVAFSETLGLLNSAGVAHAGGGLDPAAAHAPLIVERNGLRVAFLSYVTGFTGPYNFSTRSWEARPGAPIGVAIARAAQVTVDVTAARELADVVVVAIHGDGEFRRMPNTRQRRKSAAAIAAGADLVIGHGAHVLHGYRVGDHTLIAYGLGNFVFDRYVGEPNYSVILDVTLSAQGVESFSWIPIVIRHGFPRPASGADVTHIMSRLKPI
jgi:poly-gamma-glutamate synthesis protein (capsule biosynthesis protein)